MPRLIEVQHPDQASALIEVQVGDMLLFRATGGRVLSEGRTIDVVGAFSPAMLGLGGEVLSAEGPPNTLFVRAIAQGTAQLEVMMGDPWQSSQASRVVIRVV